MIKLRISEKLCQLLGIVPSPYRSKRIGSALIFGFGCIIGVSVLILTAIIFMFPSISSSLMNPMLQNNLNRYYHKISSPHSSQSSPSTTTSSPPPPPPPLSSSSPPPPPPPPQSPKLLDILTENTNSQTGINYTGNSYDNSSSNVSIDLPKEGELVDAKENLLSTSPSNSSSSYSNTAYGGDDDEDCDIYDGEWVRDVNQEPYYPPGSCPYIEKQPFDCYFNGKRDNEYLNWQWQWKSHPRNTGCSKNIPSFFNGTDFLERLRGKKLDYNCTVAYVWSVFLVNETNSKTRRSRGSELKQEVETLRLDQIDGLAASVYQDADIVVFDSYHWWVEGKTNNGINYFQEGDYLYPKLEIKKAFRKALTTWRKWIDNNIDSAKTQVVFRGFSLSHYVGGKWNTGGKCNLETEPIRSKEKYVNPDQSQLKILEDTLRKMKTPVIYMNVSKLTYYRSDGHPSVYGRNYTAQERIAAIQDCSHWCLPGVPDTWNELLYVSLVKAGKGSFGLR
ncbi:hypothetical protein C5167_006649 [Papaver somniferum]|uniref:Uncharacterized protein n=1 Tax=Papaver somniferum TaxID=3469 RepID=A0A4Y7JEU8_PAPSO|nr:hypothetical protein C5167_006649 [Papaver somniferum]